MSADIGRSLVNRAYLFDSDETDIDSSEIPGNLDRIEPLAAQFATVRREEIQRQAEEQAAGRVDTEVSRLSKWFDYRERAARDRVEYTQAILNGIRESGDESQRPDTACVGGQSAKSRRGARKPRSRAEPSDSRGGEVPPSASCLVPQVARAHRGCICRGWGRPRRWTGVARRRTGRAGGVVGCCGWRRDQSRRPCRPASGPVLVTYGVEFTRTAERDLSRLDKTVAQQVLDRLRWLAENADSVSHRRSPRSLRALSACVLATTGRYTAATKRGVGSSSTW